jgi:hypothetical protein
MILDTILFIVYYRTASVATALKSIKTAAARRAAVLLRLRQRTRNIFFEIVERAHYLEQEGADRKVAVEQLVSEFRIKLEEELRRTRTIFNFVVMSAAMVVMMIVLVGVILGILSPLASQYATMLTTLLLFPLYALEPFHPPIRKWDYWLTALFTMPAVAAYFVPQAAYATIPAALIYAVWYYIPRYTEAQEEFRMAVRGRVAFAATPLAKQAVEITRAVRQSGAFDIQATAEYLLRLAEHHYSSLRREGLMRGLIIISFVVVGAFAVAWLWPQLATLAEQAKEGPIPLYFTSPKPMLWLVSLAAAAATARMTESYAALPLYTPIMLTLLLV